MIFFVIIIIIGVITGPTDSLEWAAACYTKPDGAVTLAEGVEAYTNELFPSP